MQYGLQMQQPYAQPSSEAYRDREQPIVNIKASRDSNDRMLLEKLDEALSRDLKDKSSAHRVGICSKVWAEIIRREEPVIASLLTKIKQSYEQHIKNQNKILAQ
jgi:hypothetical protein